LFDDFVVLVYVRIRLSDTSGQVLPRRIATSRRKHLCKDWWNKEWLDRLLAVCQHLDKGDKIIIGERHDEQLIINASPLCLNAPIGINEVALDRLFYDRSDMLMKQEDETAEDQANQNEVEDD
jgi:hypothetical protein